MIADERRALAAQLADLTPQQQASPSLCPAWTVHHVVAHLVIPLEVSVPAVVLQVLAAGGRSDRANERVTARLARRPFSELLHVLREQADSRSTPPGSGPEAPLVDLLAHGLDVRWPLGQRAAPGHDRPPGRPWCALTGHGVGLLRDRLTPR